MSGYNSGAVKAQFDVNVERKSANIAQKLPFAFLGANSLVSGYQSILSIPNGLTLEVNSGLGASDYGITTLTFDDGSGNSDIIEISSSTIEYPELLESSKMDLIQYSGIKMVLSNNMDTSQFNERLLFLNSSIFGNKRENPTNPAAYVSKNQNQNNQVDLPLTGDIDKNTAIVSNFRNETGIISFNFYVTRFALWNARQLG